MVMEENWVSVALDALDDIARTQGWSFGAASTLTLDAGNRVFHAPEFTVPAHIDLLRQAFQWHSK